MKSRIARKHWALPVLLSLLLVALLGPGAGTAQAHFCQETWNPAQQPIKFAGVPGGTSTLPGTTVHGPINPDGFYIVSGNIWSDSTFIMNFAVPTPIKYTERGNGTPIVTTSRIGGPNSFIQWHIQAPGDLYVGETVNSRTFCGVPPPPF